MWTIRFMPWVAPAALLLALLLPGREISSGQERRPLPAHAAYASFRDIPGVTDEEIKAIEAFQKQNTGFVYGMLPSTEAFLRENGEIGGYATLVCDWLTTLFKMPFKPALYEWSELLAGLERREIDFTAELTPGDAHRKNFYMTDAIAERPVKTMRIANSAPFTDIAVSRPLRFAFLDSSVTDAAVAARTQYPFERIRVHNFRAAYAALQSGKADAFLAEGGTEAFFATYDDVVVHNFFPLIHSPVSLATQNPSLQAIISVVQKALRHGAARHLAELYNQGQQDYMKHRLRMQLSEEEKAYLRDHHVVRFAAEFYNYPVSFYNAYEQEWQGIALDLIREVEKLTALSFERANSRDTAWPELVKMLEDGTVSMITELLHTEDRAKRFLWPKTVTLADSFALLSKSAFPGISMDKVRNVKVGLAKATAHAALFRNWFPNHRNIVEYASTDEAFRALERDEVDMVMSSQRMLLALTNYHEFSSYKANIVFDFASQSRLGFNGKEALLCSIVDKALKMLDVPGVAARWVHNTYDYKGKLAQAQRPWLIGVSGLLLSVLILLGILFLRKRHEGRELEDLVHARTRELEAVINNYKGVIWSVDNKGVITLFNGRYLQTIGVTPSFLEGKKLEVARLKNRHLDIIENVEKTFREGPQDWIGEIDGGVFHSHTVPMRDGTGAIVGVVGSTDDVTATIMLQRDLETAVESAKIANQSKSAFLANMSHEIRTPMNAILGITELQLQDEKLAPVVREAFGRIYDAGDMLLAIINDILDMSKIEAGKLELLPAEYEIASLINDSVQLNIMRIGSKQVEFELHVDENTPAAMVGDMLRIKQILNNVLSNAFKYTEKGLVTLSISHERGREDGPSQYELQARETWKEQDDVTLVFLVRDTGHGMTPEQTRRMFDEYSRFNQPGERVIEGTGLGMNITQQLVRMMNGEIFVESEPGSGSAFTVRLPQRAVGAGVLGRELADKLRQFRLNDLKQMRRAQIIREPMPYGSVLVVDDVATNLYVAKGLLASYGLKVDLAESGFEAIEKIEQGRVYDIVFMDHMMPEMDGMKATQAIRDRGYTQPVVALTANALVGQAEIYLENGFDDFISKPIDLRQMNAILNKFVRDRHPPEIVEAARRQAQGAQEHRADATPLTALEPNLAKIFLRDASKALAVLEKLGENQDAYSDEDMRTFTLTLHGLKSALANIDEADLAGRARILEEAGRARDSALMASESPAFLMALREVAERITPAEDDGHSAATDEDRAYLRDKLLALKAACMTYDKKAAKEALTATGQRAWPPRTREMLDAIAEHLLHSKFKNIVSIVDDAMRTL